MFPYGKKDKEIRKPSLSGDFDSFFAEMEDYMAQAFAEAQRGGGRSFVYGYSAYTGADGKPEVREYSNIPGFQGRFQLPSHAAAQLPASPASEQPYGIDSVAVDGTVEPFFDVFEDCGNIKVSAELPGVEEKDIHVSSTGSRVSLKAANDYRSYAADIPLPCAVKAKAVKTQYKNGVLELTYKKN